MAEIAGAASLSSIAYNLLRVFMVRAIILQSSELRSLFPMAGVNISLSGPKYAKGLLTVHAIDARVTSFSLIFSCSLMSFLSGH